MKKRIYKSMLVLALTTILLTSFLITGVMYRAFYLRMQQEKEFFSRFADSDGTVLFDNFTDAEQMENHLNRPEIADALKNGFGEAVHLSKTLGTQTFYWAVRLNDGTVLRVSATTNSVFKSVLVFFRFNHIDGYLADHDHCQPVDEKNLSSFEQFKFGGSVVQ